MRSYRSQKPAPMLIQTLRRRCSLVRSRTLLLASSGNASTAWCGSGTLAIRASAGVTPDDRVASFASLADAAWRTGPANSGPLDGRGYRRLDWRSPVRIARVATPQHVVELGFEGTGHGSDLAVADGVFVDGDNRAYLSGGAASKD